MAGLGRVMHCVGASLCVFGSSPGRFLSKGQVWSISLTLVGIQCLSCTLSVDCWAYLIGPTSVLFLDATPQNKTWPVFVNYIWCLNKSHQAFPHPQTCYRGADKLALSWHESLSQGRRVGRTWWEQCRCIYLTFPAYILRVRQFPWPPCKQKVKNDTILKGCPQVTHPEARKLSTIWLCLLSLSLPEKFWVHKVFFHVDDVHAKEQSYCQQVVLK